MTNPGDAVGTNGGYGGRTSVNAFNDVLSAFSGRGIVKGWACVPKTGMTVSLGGQEMVRDVAIAENDLGQFTTIDNISVQPIDVTLSDAPTLGQRIDAIVAYVTSPPDSNGQLIDNPDACGLIVVENSVTTNPTAPDEAMIREAITADGGSGVTAYYVVLATVRIGTGANAITNTEITQGDKAFVPIPDGSITGDQIADETITSQNVDWATIPGYARSTTEQRVGTWIDNKPLYERVLAITVDVKNEFTVIPHNIATVDQIWLAADSFAHTISASDENYPITNSQPNNSFNRAGIISAHIGRQAVYMYMGAFYTPTGAGQAQFILTVHYTKATD